MEGLLVICARVRLRAFESSAGKVAGKTGAIAKVLLEQLSELFAREKETGAVAALRPLVCRTRPDEGEPALPAGICPANGAAPGGTQRSEHSTDSSRQVFWSRRFYRPLAGPDAGSISEHHHARERTQTEEQKAQPSSRPG